MARDDDTPTTVAGGAGAINPLLPNAFLLGGDSSNVSLEELKRRRAIAVALAARQRGYPKTLGEGLTSFGQDIGDVLAERRLNAQERAYRDRIEKTDPTMRPVSDAAPTTAAPVAAVPEAAAPPPAAAIAPPSGPNGVYTEVPVRPTVDTDRRRPLPAGLLDPALIGAGANASDPAAQRERIARLLNPPPEVAGMVDPTVGAAQPPRGGRLASLNPLGTLSDAPPIGGAPVADENPPTPTSIAPMPVQLAQVGAGAALGPGGAAMGPNPVPLPAVPGAAAAAPPAGIPGPLAPPTPVPPPPTVGRYQMAPQFTKVPTEPTPPPQLPMTEYEKRGYRALQMFPGDENVAARAKLLIDHGQKQRAAEYARRVEEYKLKYGVFEKEITAGQQFQREGPKREIEQQQAEFKLAKEKREEEDRQRLGGIAPEVFSKGIEKSYEKVQGMPAAVVALAGARRSLEEGKMFTGLDAEIQLSIAKAKAAAGFPADPRIRATEEFRANIAPIIASSRAALAGSANISDKDMEAARQAAAGDIKLDRESIVNVLRQIEAINLVNAVEHQRKVLTFAGNDPDRQRMLSGFMLPMEQIVPDAAVQRLRENDSPDVRRDFDRTFHTPGLAARVLQFRR